MAVNQKNTKPGQPDDFLRIQDLLYLCLARWKWFVLSLAITTGVAAVYLLCTPAVYTRTASVLIKEDSKGKSVSPDLESFSEFGLFQSSTNVNNELITFQSPALMTEVCLLYTSLEYARDLFMFSFYTRGMSFIDMVQKTADDRCLCP